MAVAIFLFSKGCGSCVSFKQTIREDVKNLYLGLGLRIKEFEAEYPAAGIMPSAEAPEFLQAFKLYPTVILVDEEMYSVSNVVSLGTLYSKMLVLNYNLEAVPPAIVVEYNYAQVSEYKRLYNNFLRKCQLNREVQLFSDHTEEVAQENWECVHPRLDSVVVPGVRAHTHTGEPLNSSPLRK